MIGIGELAGLVMGIAALAVLQRVDCRDAVEGVVGVAVGGDG